MLRKAFNKLATNFPKPSWIVKTGLGVLVLSAAIFVTTSGSEHTSYAQVESSQLIVNWRTNTYVPPDFSGKALPTSESPVTIGVDLISGGRKVDLSASRVFWHVDDDFYQGGIGLTRATILTPRFIGQTSIQVRVALPDHQGNPAKTIIIPIVSPEVVIQSSAPNLATAATPFRLYAHPYFFNARDPSDLMLEWRIRNSIVGRQNPLVVTRDISMNGPAEVKLTVSNPKNLIEKISESLTIFR